MKSKQRQTQIYLNAEFQPKPITNTFNNEQHQQSTYINNQHEETEHFTIPTT